MEGQVANKPRKKGSTSLVVKEMPIITTIFVGQIRTDFGKKKKMCMLAWVCRETETRPWADFFAVEGSSSRHLSGMGHKGTIFSATVGTEPSGNRKK